MPARLPGTNEPPAVRDRRSMKWALWLGVVAALFYFGFIAMHWHGRG
ncbi:MAG: hypothetical protein ACT4NU_10425 [Chromatiales bacterium]